MKQCRLPLEKVMRVTPTVADLSAYNTDIPFDPTQFFCPTAPAIYKNNDAIFKACELLQKKALRCEVTLTIPQQYSHDNVHCVGGLPYEEVITRYAGSTLIFPSYIETFGFPMAEARKVGTIVLASDCPFSHEVLEGYENAYFFDPYQPQELADLMERVMRGDIARQAVPVVQTAQRDSWLEVMDIVRRTV